MANEVRVARLESLIKDVINNALANEINDKIAKLARVTAERLSNDLSVAKIFLDAHKRESMLKVLENVNKVSGLLRSKLAAEWTSYKVPELRFVIDETIDYANHIDELFKKIKQQEN